MNDGIFPVIIVAYNPDERLQKNVQNLSCCNILRDIIVVDNSTEESKIIQQISVLDKVTVISCHGNKGIAYAQNIGIAEAEKKKYKWALTLDHDTIVDNRLLEKYYAHIENNDCSNIAILSTDYYDIGADKLAFNNGEPVEAELVISSGSLINIDIFNKLGRMKEHYFIDQVDNEYCYRVLKNKYQIIVLPGSSMEHRLGNIKQVHVLGFKFHLYNQPPIRTYYRTRNCIYFIREYKDISLTCKKMKSLCIDFIKLLFEDDTYRKSVEFFRGIYHGLTDTL